VWVAEAYGSDAPTALAWLAAQTSTIGLGTAVMQIPARTPAMTAMTAATLDLLSGGRFQLGLGVSGPQVSEGWHGVPFG
jgi:alkanesulfonate monooxygenase SsuD/methylene tetrahydromethanopterin reductase-like flavin-dependent oxidoreductase (luciferase family)